MEEERLVMSGFREEEDDQEGSLRPKPCVNTWDSRR